ncbi:uroporphyrinogen-III synthase [Sulfitobacter sp. SK012]|uniref:uroporphyrinogen-III synthase n=1 Tax=Sulfitobacter sp. SK012 TaxID=1389005 RepID=UPI0013B4263E|nr:uroporphyrinogen-III synthase [Sulfitobacter sp. SK012]
MADRTLLLTRPQASSERFVARLDPLALSKVQVVISPLLEIVPLDTPVSLNGIQAVIFTSANAVGFAPAANGMAAYCVGARTYEAARQAGWSAHLAGETAVDLIAHILDLRPKGPLLHLAGHHRRGDIGENLSKSGIQTQTLTLYDQILRGLSSEALSALQGTTIVPLFSPRTALKFMQESPDMRHVHAVALSGAVADPLASAGLASLEILPSPQGDKMVKAVESLCLRVALP